MPGDVAFSGEVELVVTPVSGYAIGSSNGPAALGPPDDAVGVTVKIHPLGDEVAELRCILEFQVCGIGQHRPLDCYVKPFDLLRLLHPRQRVLGVENDDEARAKAGVFLPPELHDLI